MVSLYLPFFFCVTFFILRDLVSNFFAGAVVLPGTAVVPGEGVPVTAGLSEGDSELPGVAESVGEGLTTGVVDGTEVSAGVPVAVGTAESVGAGFTTGVVVGTEVPEGVPVGAGVAELVGKGVFVGSGFPEGSIVADGDADICTSFFKSSMICCSEFFRFSRGVI